MPVIKFKKGDTYSRELTFKDKAGAAINITNYTIWFMVKENEDDLDAAALINRKILPASHTTPLQGISQLTVLPAHTDDVEAGQYFGQWQIQTGAVTGIYSTDFDCIIEPDLVDETS